MAEVPSVTLQGGGFLAQLRSTVIGGIPVKIVLEQTHTDRIEASRFPIEDGAPVTDHAYKLPPGVRLRCGWSNSDIEAAQQIVSGIVSDFKSAGSVSAGISKVISDGRMAAATYIDGIYSRLLALQASLSLFDLTTMRRKYPHMLMTNLELITDPQTAQAIIVEATFEQFIIVSTLASQLPAMANQANPASTAEVQNTGAQSTQTGAPAPGGSLPPSSWTPKDAVSVTAGGVTVGSGLGGGG